MGLDFPTEPQQGRVSLSLEQDQDQFQGEAQVPPTPGRKVSLQCETHAVEVKCIFVGLKYKKIDFA